MSESDRKEQYVFKILLLGDGGVGKTSLLRRYIDNTFEPDYKSTIGVQFMTKVVETEDTTTKLVIWDVAGQSKFTSYRHLYYKDAEGIILIYDMTRPKTFENLPIWIEDALKHTAKNTKIALLGNKADLEDKRVVSRRHGEIFSKSNPNIVLFEETSAKTGENVNNAYMALVRVILDSTKRR
ncbi:MAG: GTP-binding protein [Candidatus Lokiarchaeota archaeon]|nr:GTP-binding protein [Candidatus Lokiarchaeota archaeon]